MDRSTEAQDYIAAATAEVQKCIETTKQQMAAARKDVLRVVELQQIDTQFQQVHGLTVEVPVPSEDTMTPQQSQASQQSQSPQTNAHTQLTEIIHLIAQQSGVSLMKTEHLAEDATEAAIKIFDDVTQIFKQMATPILREQMSTSSTNHASEIVEVPLDSDVLPSESIASP